MTSALDASIVPVTLTVNGRIGLTLWAPPWEDDEGEEWQGFLGDGAKILMFPNAAELAAFIASGEENDLSDHPAWDSVLKLTSSQLRPSADDAYDLDEVYVWAADDPDPVHVSALANVVDMVLKIADCCDDGALRGLVGGTPAYAELVDENVSYHGKDGRRRWTELGDVIAESWERAISRVEGWLSWRGDFSNNDLDSDTIWDRVGAEPIEIVLATATYFTVRGYGARSGGDTGSSIAQGADLRSEDDDVLFLGEEGNVAVFTDIADLANYCRTATEHELVHLEWWSELAEVEDDEIFRPAVDASYDLTEVSEKSAELLAELIEFCRLDVDVPDLGGDEDDDEETDEDEEDEDEIEEHEIEEDEKDADEVWATALAEVERCLQLQD